MKRESLSVRGNGPNMSHVIKRKGLLDLIGTMGCLDFCSILYRDHILIMYPRLIFVITPINVFSENFKTPRLAPVDK
ncbi:hypothetical protein BpHYR1_026309 [Brachionus plicatilis]|uniref:Uncharacterized protein n=1 Tax=Brachionus plicatilis TaxID=10195 RepID=A0A3M7RNW2_BRAPC|nr:hypothetical protein BpHYR1_026309 [Brachionus plicatilis]